MSEQLHKGLETVHGTKHCVGGDGGGGGGGGSRLQGEIVAKGSIS